MRFVIFGTGNLYQAYKSSFRRDIEIVAFIDNQADKWGKKIDGIMVYAPAELGKLEYDVIFLLSAHYLDMQMQLRATGILKDRIYTIDNHIEALCVEKEVEYYGELCESHSKKNVLIFSHALTSTGAQNVLYHAICIMKRNEYQITVVSKTDGILRKRLRDMDIPVIIIRDIYSRRAEINRLADWADVIFVNTLLLYDTVLRLLEFNKKIVWWIHETGILKYIEEDFKYIENSRHISIYAVSPLVKRLIQQNYGKSSKVKILTYGLPEYEIQCKKNACCRKTVFAIIGWIGYIKGQDVFLKAVSVLPEVIRENAEFWIVGGGKLLLEEQKIVEKYACVKVLGEIENTKMHEIYAAIDVVVCASREDAMPVAVAEGCMTEKLVIVSDAVGSADFIEHRKTGLIFESENIDGLAEQIKWAVEHKEWSRQIGAASKRIYDNCFSMRVFEKNILMAIGKQDVEQYVC